MLKIFTVMTQDKSRRVGPWALRPLLDGGQDVLLAGSFSAATVAHAAAATAAVHANRHAPPHSAKHTPAGGRVLVCAGGKTSDKMEEMQDVLTAMGCSNVKLLPVALHELDVCDARLQKVQVVLLTPACSLSAVCNPVEFLLQENGDMDLLQDLCQGNVSQSRLQTLVSHQRRDLQHALRFPKVQAVVYSTCSSFPEENNDVIKEALSFGQQRGSTLQPFRLSSPSPLRSTVSEEEEEDVWGGMKAGVFTLQASDQNNGCFLAVLTRQPDPQVKETPQEVAEPVQQVKKTPQDALAQASAKGLPSEVASSRPPKKDGRRQTTRKGAADRGRVTRVKPRPSLSDQSLVVEVFLKREAKSSSLAPAVTQERTNLGRCLPLGKAKPTNQHSSTSVQPISGSAPVLSRTPNLPFKTLTRTQGIVATTNVRRAPIAVTLPPAPPKARQEVLRPMTLTLPPVLFPSVPSSSSSSSSSSVWKSPVLLPIRTKPELSFLQWTRSFSPTAHLPQDRPGGRISHPRPWL